MSNQVPGAVGFYPYRKIEWDLREAIAVLTIALSRTRASTGLLSRVFDEGLFEGLVSHIGEAIEVSWVSNGWYYKGSSRTAQEATKLLSDGVESGDLRRRRNYKYGTAELLRWTKTVGIDLCSLLPEFGFPTQAEVDEFFQAEARKQNQENERLLSQQALNGQGKSVNIFQGPVHTVNQGNDTVIQDFGNHQTGPDPLCANMK